MAMSRFKWTKIIWIPLCLLLGSASASPSSNSSANDKVMKAIEDVYHLRERSKNWNDFLDHAPDMSTLDREGLKHILKAKPLPAVKMLSAFSFEINEKVLKIISPQNGDFSWEGHPFHVTYEMTLKQIYITLLHLESQHKSSWNFWSGILPTAEAKGSEITIIDPDLLKDVNGDAYLLKNDPTRLVEYSLSWLFLSVQDAPAAAAGGLVGAGLGAFGALSPVVEALLGAYVIDVVVTSASNYAPLISRNFCADQTKKLQTMIEQPENPKEKMMLAELDCGSWRGNDRKIDFWTMGEDRKPKKRTFKFDIRAGVLEEDTKIPSMEAKSKDSNKKKKKTKKDNDDEDDSDDNDDPNQRKVGYFFVTNWKRPWPFRSADEMKTGKDFKLLSITTLDGFGRSRRRSNYSEESIGADAVTFRKMKEDIEPIRRIIYEMNEKKFCPACEDDANKLLGTKDQFLELFPAKSPSAAKKTSNTAHSTK